MLPQHHSMRNQNLAMLDVYKQNLDELHIDRKRLAIIIKKQERNLDASMEALSRTQDMIEDIEDYISELEGELS